MRKILTILLACLLLAPMIPAGAVRTDTLTRQCKLQVSEGSTGALTDGKLSTAWKPSGENAKLLIELPESGAGFLYVQWDRVPGAFRLEQFDADENVLSTVTRDDVSAVANQVFSMGRDTRFVLLTLEDTRQAVCELDVYTPGDLPDSMQKWYNPLVASDIMVVAAHQGDEYACFGGLIPYYLNVLDRSVQVVYMTDGGRQAREEALEALWELGMRNAPVFLDLSDEATSSPEKLLKKWGGKNALLGKVVEQIRRCQPQIIVSHKLEGEAGSRQHAMTALALQYAVEAAADENQYPESAEKYGAWQVKKLYLNGFGVTQTVLDWNQNFEQLDGGTPLLAAEKAYSHYSNPHAVPLEDGETLDVSRFGLAYTVVGQDIAAEDLFENVPGYEIVEAEATPEPTRVAAKPAIVFTPDVTPAPTPEPGSAVTFGEKTLKVLKFGGIALLLILLISCAQTVVYRFQHRRGRKIKNRRIR